MERGGRDWRTIVLAVGAAGGALLVFSSAVLFALYSTLSAVQPELANANRTALDVAVMVSALAAIGAAFLPAAYYSMQRLRGRTVPAARPTVLRIWQGIVLIIIWLAAALGAEFLLPSPVAKWITPLLYVLAIGVPVLFFVRVATGGLTLGSRERTWGTLAAGIGLGITPAILAELLLALVAVLGFAIYVGLHPELLSTMQRLAKQLEGTTDIQEVLNLVGPYLVNPIALITALVFFAGLSPVIEETTKSLATWAVFDRLNSPAQGFAIGAVSGAGFGLVESLLVSATPDAGWATTLLVRGASTMMHIMSASLTGWGIGSFKTSKNYGKLIGLYLLAISLHSAWNASVVVMTFGGARWTMKAPSGPDPLSLLLMFAGGAMLLALCLAIPLAMWGINRRFRTIAALAASPAGVEEKLPAAEGGDRTEPSPPAPLT